MSRRRKIVTLGLAFTGATLLGGVVQAAPASRSSEQGRQGAAPHTVAFVEFSYADQGVYELVAAPGRITDIVLEPGETLVETNPIAAGDTARWVIGDTASGEGATRRVRVLIKPVQVGLATNLIINTNRRAYHLQLRASSRAFVSQVAWRYPPVKGKVSQVVEAPLAAVVALAPLPPEPARLNFSYRIKGVAPWRPLRVYDDGARTVIDFGPAVVLTDLPPLFIVGPDGKASELVNYSVDGRRLIVDRLFARAELRLGLKRWERRVRLERLKAGEGTSVPGAKTQEIAR